MHRYFKQPPGTNVMIHLERYSLTVWQCSLSQCGGEYEQVFEGEYIFMLCAVSSL
jgi:hypothetical protein